MKSEMSQYCLGCANEPCKSGCPIGNEIKSFIHETDMKKAYELLTDKSLLGSICSRICYREKQCEGNCTRRFTGSSVKIR